MQSALAGSYKGWHVGKSGNFSGVEHVYTCVHDRGVPARERARNERAAAVGFSEESRFFNDRCELVVATQARDRACCGHQAS